eukprot:6190822-Pleurochrysis_carterae.AAC.1
MTLSVTRAMGTITRKWYLGARRRLHSTQTAVLIFATCPTSVCAQVQCRCALATPHLLILTSASSSRMHVCRSLGLAQARARACRQLVPEARASQRSRARIRRLRRRRRRNSDSNAPTCTARSICKRERSAGGRLQEAGLGRMPRTGRQLRASCDAAAGVALGRTEL